MHAEQLCHIYACSVRQHASTPFSQTGVATASCLMVKQCDMSAFGSAEYFVEHFCEAHTCNRKEQLARLETIAQVCLLPRIGFD